MSVAVRLSPIAVPVTTLLNVLGDVPEREVRGADVVIEALAYRSSDAGPGALFFCVPGTTMDGHDFAAEAVARGASALVVERWLDLPVTQVLVPSVREAMGPVSAEFYGRPSDRMVTVGVTGTNGKTTTTYLLESVFGAAGLTPGVIGTTGVRVDGRPVPLARTTPERSSRRPSAESTFTAARAAMAWVKSMAFAWKYSSIEGW